MALYSATSDFWDKHYTQYVVKVPEKFTAIKSRSIDNFCHENAFYVKSEECLKPIVDYFTSLLCVNFQWETRIWWETILWAYAPRCFTRKIEKSVKSSWNRRQALNNEIHPFCCNLNLCNNYIWSSEKSYSCQILGSFAAKFRKFCQLPSFSSLKIPAQKYWFAHSQILRFQYGKK